MGTGPSFNTFEKGESPETMAMNGTIIALAACAATVAGVIALAGQAAQDAPKKETSVVNLDMQSPQRPDKVVRTDEEWKARLTPEQYKILRNKGTEPPFCGVNLEKKGPGTYLCVGCDLELFRAGNKFDSGTGWPSFCEPVDKDAVWYKTDRTHFMTRTEILCSRCDGHLGHVFDDGPPPSGLRYCINGTVLKFVPEK